MRPALKGVLERSLLRLGVNRLGRVFRGSERLVLAYHNVVEDGAATSGEASLHLPLAAFVAQLDLLTESCDVVPLAEILEPPGTNGGVRPRVAITFDDAYRGAIRLAIPELRRRALPATIFVAPGILGDRTFWWDALLHGARAELRESTIRITALETHRGQAEPVRAWANHQGLEWRESAPDGRSVTTAELERAAGDGIVVGSHSWSHACLPRLDSSECRSELERSRDWLRARFPSFIPWLSYPYGASSSITEKVASQCGYSGAYGIRGGWIRDGRARRFALPRLNVPAGLSTEGFGLRLAGLLCR